MLFKTELISLLKIDSRYLEQTVYVIDNKLTIKGKGQRNFLL
jgi:hypothetical protein